MKRGFGLRAADFRERLREVFYRSLKPEVASVPRSAKAEAGFTLIELSIVILIIAIVARIALPRFRSVTGAELTAATRRLAYTTRYLYEEAALRGTVLALYFDLDRQEYWVAHTEEGTGTLVEDTDLLARRVTLPPDVRIADVFVPGVGKFEQGLVPTRFYPEGYADRSVIGLVDVEGHSYTLRIDPIRGRAEISEGR
jgi:prepilin-type N-terminal cleavage/methylation domain-containing protein